MTPARIAVIDIGKTNAKLALVEAETLAEIDLVLPLKADSAWGKAVRQARQESLAQQVLVE